VTKLSKKFELDTAEVRTVFAYFKTIATTTSRWCSKQPLLVIASKMP